MIRLFLLLALLGFISVKATSLSQELLDKANRQYEKGTFDSAAATYEKILSSGLHDPRVYYNLGNACFRQKEIGRAILCYEKAHRLDPSDKDIMANLLFARSATVDKIVPREEGFLTRIFLFFHNLLSLSTQTVLVLVLLYLLSAVFIGLFVLPRFRGPFKAVAAALFVLLLLTGFSFGVKCWQDSTQREAIVLSPQVSAMNEPDGAQTLFTVHEGARFHLGRKVGSWYFASLENGISGWVHEVDLGLIDFTE
ncbi:MAG: tetratricopeptide repeat protein [Fibrobacterota bacterium]